LFEQLKSVATEFTETWGGNFKSRVRALFTDGWLHVFQIGPINHCPWKYLGHYFGLGFIVHGARGSVVV
jgi:hypothetical protein